MAALIGVFGADGSLVAALKQFVVEEAGSTAFKSKGLTDELKGRVIQAIVDELALGTSLSESETDAALVTLRILARERTGLENMQTPKALGVFWSYAAPIPGAEGALKPREEAMRVIINAIHSTTGAQQAFDEAAGITVLFRRLINRKLDGEEGFLLSRILFLLTVTNSKLTNKLVKESQAQEYLPQFIEKLLKLDSNEPIEAIAKTWTAQQTQPALELQRVLYGLWTYAIQLFVVAEQKQEDNADALKASLDAAYAKASNFAVKLLESTKTSTGTLAEIQVLAANWFIRAPHHLLQPILAKDKDMAFKLLWILHNQWKHSSPDTLEEDTAPVLMALRNVAAADNASRKVLRQELLPFKSEQRKFPQEMKWLKDQLTDHLTSSKITLKSAIGEFFLQLCRRSAHLMFKHIGVGASAGILAANSLLGGHANPIDRSENPEFSDDEPLEPPPATNGTSSAEMTEEEKEQETERLLVLFEKLERTGLVKFELQGSVPPPNGSSSSSSN